MDLFALPPLFCWVSGPNVLRELSQLAGGQICAGIFLQVFEFVADGEFLDVAEAVNEERASKVVHFVLGGAGKEALQLRGRGLAVESEMLYHNGPGALDAAGNVGKAQAAFFKAPGVAGCFDDSRIDKDQTKGDIWIEPGGFVFFFLQVVTFRDVDDTDGFGAADLLRGQSAALRGLHGGKHVVNQFVDFRGDGVDGAGGFPQYGVAIGSDGEKIAHNGKNYTPGRAGVQPRAPWHA